MIDLYDLLPHNIIVILHQKIIVLRYDSGRGILNGKHSIIRLAVLNCLHGILPGIHMEIIAVFPEKFLHGLLAVCPLQSLKHNSRISAVQSVHLLKFGLLHNTVLRQKLILLLTAHGHDLFKKLPDTVSGKIRGSLLLQRRKL